MQFSTPCVFGLNSWAENFVAHAKKELTGEHVRLYEASRPLYRYTLPNGRVYTEKIQSQRQSKNQFLALENEHGIWLIDSLLSRSEISEVCSFL